MSAPYDTVIPSVYYDMAWAEFNAGDFHDEINDIVMEHAWDATRGMLSLCYPMEGEQRGKIARFKPAEDDFKSHVDVIIERRAGELMRDNT